MNSKRPNPARFSVGKATLLTALALLLTGTANADHGKRYKPWKSGFNDRCYDVAEIHVYAGRFVDAVEVVCGYRKFDRRAYYSGAQVFRLRPGEFVTGISGTKRGKKGAVTGLRFHTNYRTSRPFGMPARHGRHKAFFEPVRPGRFVARLGKLSNRYDFGLDVFVTPTWNARYSPRYYDAPRYYEGRPAPRYHDGRTITRQGYRGSHYAWSGHVGIERRLS